MVVSLQSIRYQSTCARHSTQYDCQCHQWFSGGAPDYASLCEGQTLNSTEYGCVFCTTATAVYGLGHPYVQDPYVKASNHLHVTFLYQSHNILQV